MRPVYAVAGCLFAAVLFVGALLVVSGVVHIAGLMSR